MYIIVYFHIAIRLHCFYNVIRIVMLHLKCCISSHTLCILFSARACILLILSIGRRRLMRTAILLIHTTRSVASRIYLSIQLMTIASTLTL